MTYLWLSLPFLLGAAIVGHYFAVLSTRGTRGRPGDAGPDGAEHVGALRRHRLATLLAFAALAVLTIVFDSLMIASDLFSFGTDHLVGIYLGLAPIEDLAYPLVCVLLGPGLWLWLRGRASTREADA